MNNSIDEVIQQLEALVLTSEQEESPAGYFAALYLDVTRTIKAAIDQGTVFENNQRMEAVDLCFASRYFDAMATLGNDKAPTLPWQITFAALKMTGIVVDQHLLAAANAHINFDLAIAVGQTCRGDEIAGFKKDFDTMNAILFRMNNAVNGMIVRIWPPISLVLHVFGSDMLWIEDAVMKKDRTRAWSYAVRIATAGEAMQQAVIREMEIKVWRAGVQLILPPLWLRLLFGHIAKQEKGDVAYRIRCLVEKMNNSNPHSA